MSNSWIDLVAEWGQNAIDDKPIRIDRKEGREDLFDAVIESLKAKENTRSVLSKTYAEEGGKKYVLVPLSGGLDSLVAYERAKDLGHKVRAFYVMLNTPYAKAEYDVCSSLAIAFETINHSNWPLRWEPYKTHWQHILPLRNLLIILSIAEKVDERPGEIWLGATQGEIPAVGGDKSLKFFTSVDSILSTYPIKHSLKFPLRHETKTDLVSWWVRSGRKIDVIKKTVTCQAGTEIPCGVCHACFNRWVAMTNNGIQETMLGDPRKIRANVLKVEEFSAALKINDFDTWSERRILQTLSAWFGEQWPKDFHPSTFDRLMELGLR